MEQGESRHLEERDRVIQYALFLLLIALPFYGFLPDNTAGRWFLLSVSVSLLWLLFLLRKRKVEASSPLFPLFLLWLLWGFLSLFWARNLFEWEIALLHRVMVILIFFLTCNLADRENEKPLFLYGILLSATFQGGAAFLQLCGIKILGYSGVPPDGFLANPNYLGELLMGGILAGIVLYEGSLYKRSLIPLLLLSLLLQGSMMAATTARAAFLGLLSGALFLLFQPLSGSLKAPGKKRFSFQKSLPYLVAFGGFVLTLLVLPKSVELAKGKMGVSGRNAVARLTFWKDTLRLVKDHPLTGVGAGNLEILYPQYKSYPETLIPPQIRLRWVHNDYLQMMAEEGIPGLLLFLLLLVLLLKGRSLSAEERSLTPERVTGASSEVFRSLLLAFVVNNFFSFGFQMALPSLLFWGSAGLLWGWPASLHVPVSSLTTPHEREVGKKKRRFPFILLFSLLILFILLDESRRHLAEWNMASSLTHARRGEFTVALDLALSGFRLDPGMHQAPLSLSDLYQELGDVEKAEEFMKVHLSRYPSSYEGYYRLGRILEKRGELQGAEENFKKAMEIYPLYSLPHLALGVLAMNEGKEERAREEFLQAMQLNPALTPASCNYLGILAEKAGKIEEATRYYQKGLMSDPDSKILLMNLASALQKTGKTQEAISILEGLLREDPADQEVLARLSQVRRSLREKKP